MNKHKGVTLIALVITIIVLLILAGVGINIVVNPEGIIQKAEDAKNLNNKKVYREELDVALLSIMIENDGKTLTSEELKAQLEDKLPGWEFSINTENGNIIAKKDGYIFEIDNEYNVIEKEEEKPLEETIAEFFTFDATTGTIKGINASYLTNKTINDESFCNIVIPKKINDVEVTKINNNAFAGITNLNSVYIQEGVTTIGTYAFNGCTSLATVNIPSTVTTIGNNAFYNCSVLTSIKLPSISAIATSTFYNTGLKEIVIPEGVTMIDAHAFNGCTQLEKVIMPSTVTYIGSYAFSNCEKVKEVTIPIQIPVSTKFEDSKIIEKVTFIKPEGKDTLSSNSCKGLAQITEITIPEGVKTIGSSAFNNCTALTKVTIPSTVTTISGNIFAGCTNLTQIINHSSAAGSPWGATNATVE